MTVTYHQDIVQGSDEWMAARCGLITGSEVKLILTPTLKPANNDKTRAHIWELAAQRITEYVEPSYIGDEMLRGHEDELTARDLYRKHIAPVDECGFITNDRWGFVLGCSVDGLVGEDGIIECKSRRQKFQVETLVNWFRDGSIPVDFVLQVQANLLITERKWCDLISYSGGLHMVPMRVHADPEVQAAIEEAAAATEAKIAEAIADYHAALAAEKRLIPTERRIEQEMFI